MENASLDLLLAMQMQAAHSWLRTLAEIRALPEKGEKDHADDSR